METMEKRYCKLVQFSKCSTRPNETW